MAEIVFPLWTSKRPYDGARFTKHEEPVYTDTPNKTKSRLRDKKRKRERDQIPHATQTPSEVRVSKANWLGRRERGDPY